MSRADTVHQLCMKAGYSVPMLHDDARDAIDRIEALYGESLADIERRFRLLEQNKPVSRNPMARYPFAGIHVDMSDLNDDASFSYGIALDPGFYASTLTRPALFRDYYCEQLTLLVQRHKCPIVTGLSHREIPLPFAVEESLVDLGVKRAEKIANIFNLPDLSQIDDAMANGAWAIEGDRPHPMSLFTAQRVDYSLVRLHHYTATRPEYFQRFVLLTNYQRYVDQFIDYARQQIATGSEDVALISPGNVIEAAPGAEDLLPDEPSEPPQHLPQMPAWHLYRRNGDGITLVNIGVGPSNAKTMTDHLAVLRPHCFLMLGHAAGLRRSQQLGDYILAHAYVREDNVLNDDLPPEVPIPAIAEVQVALTDAVEEITGLHGMQKKTRMRTGTVLTTDNRNWEVRYKQMFPKLSQNRAIAVDMESATIAANGFRFRVPYGTLLCVSDKPLHGELKLRGMANQFYRERVQQHLAVGIKAIDNLRNAGIDNLHSRKLRNFDEPPFR